MPWTYASLKAAIAALSPMPASPDQIAAAVNAQTIAATADVMCADVEKVVVPTGEFFAIYQTSLKTPSGQTPATQTDQVIAAAWAFYRMLNQWTTIQTSNAAVLAAVRAGLTGLQSAGLLSAASVAAIDALWTANAPVWVPAVTAGDVQTAEAQP
jgi:hypothetical protein